MLRNLCALFLLFVLGGIIAEAQQKTETPKPEPRLQFFSSFDGSYLGVQTQEVTRENFSKYGLSAVRGVAVEKVFDDSPAARAGLQAGDVIVRFDGEEVTSTRKLTRLIAEVAPDHQTRLTVLRGGSEREITVTMGKRPAPKFENGVFQMNIPPIGKMDIPVAPRVGDLPKFKGQFPERIFTPGEGGVFYFGNNRQIGVGVSTLTKQLGEFFGVADGKGILINNVRADSPAAKAGLKAGDIITEVEGKPVDDMGDLIRAVNEKKEGEVTLTIVRDRNRQTIRLTPERIKGDSFFYNFDEDDNGVLTPAVPSAPRAPVAPTPAIAPPADVFSLPVIL